MGLTRNMRDLTKEFLRDPKGQYFRHLEKILNLHKQSKVSKEEVIEYVEEWKNK